jgi:hypothetical protein
MLILVNLGCKKSDDCLMLGFGKFLAAFDKFSSGWFLFWGLDCLQVASRFVVCQSLFVAFCRICAKKEIEI